MARSRKLVFDKPERAYLLCVMKDKEFQTRALKVREDLGDKALSASFNFLRTSIMVGNDEVPREDRIYKDVEELAWDFDLDISRAVDLINDKEPPEYMNMHGPVGVVSKLEGEDGGPSIKIYVGEGATKPDILTAIEGIEEDIKRVYGTYTQRTKYPENYQLIYATHRARRKGMKFSEIFRLYSLGELNNYSGSRGITGLNKFTEYYRKYEPTPAIAPEESALKSSDVDGVDWVLDADDNTGQIEREESKKHVKKTGMNLKKYLS